MAQKYRETPPSYPAPRFDNEAYSFEEGVKRQEYLKIREKGRKVLENLNLPKRPKVEPATIPFRDIPAPKKRPN